MKGFLRWIGESNRWLHLAAGFVCGLLLGIGGAVGMGVGMELKDVQGGGKFDAADCVLTCAGGVVGGVLRALAAFAVVLWL